MRYLAAMLLLAACSGGGDGDDGTDAAPHTDTPTVPLELSPTILLDDTTSFSWTATAAIPTQEVVTGSDYTIDFAGLTTDLWGRARSPSEVVEVQIQARAESPSEIATSVAQAGADPLLAVDFWYVDPAGRTRVNASEFSQTGHAFDPGYWGTQSEHFLVALVDADVRTISATIVTMGTAGSTVTVGEARVDGTPTWASTAPATASDMGPWTIDWSGLSRDGAGAALDPLTLEQLFVARFASEADLAAGLATPEAADGFWVKYVQGRTSLPLEEIHDLSGEAFPGFTPDGAWLVGARCGSCPTPVPRAATRVLVPR